MIKSYEKHMICIYLSMNNLSNLSVNNLSVFFFAPNRVLLLLITNCNIKLLIELLITEYLFIPLLLLGAALINLINIYMLYIANKHS